MLLSGTAIFCSTVGQNAKHAQVVLIKERYYSVIQQVYRYKSILAIV